MLAALPTIDPETIAILVIGAIFTPVIAAAWKVGERVSERWLDRRYPSRQVSLSLAQQTIAIERERAESLGRINATLRDEMETNRAESARIAAAHDEALQQVRTELAEAKAEIQTLTETVMGQATVIASLYERIGEPVPPDHAAPIKHARRPRVTTGG